MGVGTYALITAEYAKAHMGLADTDLHVPGLSVYHDAGASSTAATVQVTSAAVVLVVTGGTNAGTSTVTFAASTTLSAMATAINALSKGWVAVAVGYDSAASSDLVELAATDVWGADAKLVLDVVDNYSIDTLVDAATSRIEAHCGRKFKSRSYTELLNGTGTPWLYLPQYPVTALTRLTVGRSEAVEVTCSATDASRGTVHVLATTDVTGDAPDASAASVVLTITGGSSAAATELDLTDAANDTLTELVAVIAATTGWDATLKHTSDDAGNRVSADLIPTGALNCVAGDDATLYIADDSFFDYRIDPAIGALHRPGSWPIGLQNIKAVYTAGYATVPAALQWTCAQFCKELYDQAARDTTLESERTRTYSWKAKAASAPLSRTLQDKLSPYARVET